MKPVLHSFAYCLDYLREQVADIPAADMTAQPNGIMNHPLWLIGHLAYACQKMGGVLGLAAWLPLDWEQRYGTGSVPVDDGTFYEPMDAALAILGDAQSRIVEAVSKLNDAQLDEPFPDASLLDVFPTVRHALTQVLVGHSAYHIGQLSLWRRAKGLPTLRRSFE